MDPKKSLDIWLDNTESFTALLIFSGPKNKYKIIKIESLIQPFGDTLG